MNMDDIANNSKVTLIWRSLLFFLSVITTVGIGGIFGYAKSADGKLNQTMSDVAQIKWELPVIKERAVSDKAEVLRQIESLENRIQAMRELGDTDRKEIGELKTAVALLKQKLQIMP